MDLVIRLIEALAWPIAVVWLALLFRSDLRSLLSRISHVKYGDAEAKFEVGVDNVPRLPKPAASNKIGLLEPINKKEEDLQVLAQTSRRAAVLEAWQQVEKQMAGAAARLHFPLSEPDRVWSSYAEMEKLRPAFEQMRELRNQAAHAPSFNPRLVQVHEYIRKALALAALMSVAWDVE